MVVLFLKQLGVLLREVVLRDVRVLRRDDPESLNYEALLHVDEGVAYAFVLQQVFYFLAVVLVTLNAHQGEALTLLKLLVLRCVLVVDALFDGPPQVFED